ncbi:MAG: tRNA pseudouridine(38-40) synthase TruA [Planctomycetes bacterium]|nr:tRNA pseudouridine(38-40) synthase TruA [Planctomycetota bacterium]
MVAHRAHRRGAVSGSGASRIRLTLEYDGTAFHGWQIQKGHRSVQAEVVEAIRRVTGETVTLIGASRTDAGVHARGQVAHFDSTTRIPVTRLPHALNAHLPPDIVVHEARLVPASFHAQFGAKWKTYAYSIWNHPTRTALDRDRAWLVRRPLNAAAMRRAARALVGRHDFTSFGSETDRHASCVRTIRALRIGTRGSWIRIEVVGNGFLYTMVRTMVGTLAQVGLGKWPAAKVAEVRDACDRREAGPTAPPQGLCLERVDYRARRPHV